MLPTCKPVPPVKGGAPPKLRVQLWNEMNHVQSMWVRDSACELFSALGRGARATAGIDAQLWVNVMADDPQWQHAVDEWVAPIAERGAGARRR